MSEIPIGLDNLATSGIIDFDANAYIKGTKPRYVGRPQSTNYPPFERPSQAYPVHQEPPLVAHSQPIKDELVKHDKQSWKKVLLGALAAGVTLLGVVKLKGKISSLSKAKQTKNPIGNGVKKPVVDFVKDLTGNIAKKLSKVSTWAKVSGGSLLGLLGLMGLYKAASSSHQNKKH